MPVPNELVDEIAVATDAVIAETTADGGGNDDAGNDDAGKTADEGETADDEANDDAGDAGDSGKTGDAGDPGEGTGEGDDDAGDEGDDAGDEDKGKKVDPEPVTISDDALSAAVIAGIPLAEARSFASEDALLRVVDTIRSTVESQIAAAGTGKETKEAEEEEKEDPLANLPELDPELAPEIRQTFDVLKDMVRKQQETIKSFQTQQEQTATASQQAAAQELQQWFDTQVDNLGEDFAEALGKGAMSTLSRGSSQYAKRDQIANQMAVLLAGYQASGQQAPPREQVFDTAAKLVLMDQFASVRERELSKDLGKRAGQHISRAGGKKTKTNQSPLEETADLIDRKFFPKGR